MRLDSPFGLAIAGTLAIHTLLIVGADAVTVMNPYERKATPRIELVEVEVPPVLKPPPPPVKPPEPEPQAKPEPPKEAPKPPTTRAIQPTAPPPTPAEPPPPAAEPEPEPTLDSGGAPTVAMPDIAPSATGIPVAVGKRNTGKVGRGGRGTGTGAGTGSGSGDAPPAPVSIASIKTLPAPRGDYSYTNEYPAEARRLGIAGSIQVELIVDRTGKVKRAALLNRLGHGLDDLALSRAWKLEFDPAVDTEGRTVDARVVWTFTMVPPK